MSTQTAAPAAFLIHRATEFPCPSTAPEDRVAVVGQVPTCGDCRDAFVAGYCPGFNIWDVEVTWDDQRETIRVASDGRETAAHAARWTVSQHYSWPHREVHAAAVTFVSRNPAADAWDAARA
jgi:hypothetical protein